MSSLIGKPLQGGKYKLESVLGRGGFGLTFRAHQNYLDQVVVIKTLNESYWRSPNLEELQRQFQDEARRLALCSHPNVVRVSDFFIEDQLPYMVMDYIPGRSLYDIVLPETGSPQPLSEAVAVSYATQIGSALQAVHSKGLLHRDIKPQNIMVHQLTGEAVLIDFGIARELSQNPNKTHTSIVSEGYAPIEQYLPKAQRSAATDIYGLAATMYTLLTGVVPVAAVLRDRNPLVPIQQLRPDVSDGVVGAIAQGMEVELKDRPQSVGRWLGTLTSARSSARSSARLKAGQSSARLKAGQPSARLKAGQLKTGQPKTGFFGRTQKPNSAAPLLAPNPSAFPTKVVAPAYQAAPHAGSQAIPRARLGAAGGKTVALPHPGAAQTGRQPEVTRTNTSLARPQKAKGGGCLSSLAIAALLLAGLGVAGGYWLYNQASQGLPGLPEISLPGGEPSDVAETPTDDSVETSTDEALTESDDAEAAEDSEDPEVKKPKKPKEASEAADPVPEAPETPSASNSPPLVIANSGNPANARPGGAGGIVPIPGFAPGDSEDQIRARLGEPTRESTIDGYYASVYEMVPNRVTLAYVYDPGDWEVRQSEATFSGSVDRLVMRTTLSGMLDGRSSPKIVQGLEAVRTRERDRFDFESRGLSGSIERNAYDHIHIYVQK